MTGHINLKFTVDTFPDGVVHFLDIKIENNTTDVYYKDTHTGQYTHFSSFEPFSRKTTWIKSLFHRASKLCSTKELFDKQFGKIKQFMSWNGYPKTFANYLIKKLQRHKLYNEFSNKNCQTGNENIPKIWIRLPYLGKKGEFLIKTCISKIQRSKSNIVYQVTCPGCKKSYIEKTFRRLDDRLSEHAKYHQTSAIAQHFLECENAQFISDLNNLYDRLNNTHFHTNTTACIKTLINSNCKILYCNNSINNNQLLLLEALHIKFLKPELNSGLKASKDLTLFC